jgi:hypothetical protein
MYVAGVWSQGYLTMGQGMMLRREAERVCKQENGGGKKTKETWQAFGFSRRQRGIRDGIFGRGRRRHICTWSALEH